MNFSTFKAGEIEQQYQYKSFLPYKINHSWLLDNAQLSMLLDDASRLLGELNAFSQLIPDVDFFIRMHVTKEAMTSSRIEGTQTNMEEALISEADVNPEKHDDWQEVQNYIKAMNQAMDNLESLPLSNRLLKKTHRVLLQGVRGKHKQPGDFRSSQNWIGASLKHAIFVPPHAEHIGELMSDLELFIHNDTCFVPHLIKIALIHYQFETIHPFLDGNGRLGRMLITLYLVDNGLLKKPSLYLSDFFERNKGEYYDRLMAVRTTNNITEWVKFFLIGVEETAQKSINVFKEIIKLKAKIEEQILPELHTRKQENAKKLINNIYSYPIMNLQDVCDLLSIKHNTATALVNDFQKLGILTEFTGKKRNRLFAFHNYIQIFK